MTRARWSAAMREALYGPSGFFVRDRPADHFRTSVHASPTFAAALLRLVTLVDDELGHPPRLDVVDVGAGRGELLSALVAMAPDGLRPRLAPVAVEVAPVAGSFAWAARVPAGIVGVLLATEWLDNVPLDVSLDCRYITVGPDGSEAVDGPLDDADAAWLARWWPSGPRRELGRARDLAWAAAAGSVARGLALAVDYGHRSSARPVDGSLTGFHAGRQVPPIPDGSCDLTAHVAIDAVAAAAGLPYALLTQRDALRALGVSGARPPLALASTDPAGYVRALSQASAAAELTEPAGLGGHWWLLHPVGIDPQSVTRWTGSPVTRGIAA